MVRPNTSRQMPPTPQDSFRDSSLKRRCSGVGGLLSPSIRPAMRPITVWPPQATTTPSPRPRVTGQPIKARQRRSDRGVSRPCAGLSQASAVFSAGRASPLREDSSQRRSKAASRRRSAGTTSPASSSTTSPTTSSRPGMITTSPARLTRASSAVSRARAAVARRARPSWNRERAAFASTTPAMMAASVHSPRKEESKAASSSTVTMGSPSWPKKRRNREGGGLSGSLFSPCRCRRAAAWAGESPCSPLPAAASASRAVIR